MANIRLSLVIPTKSKDDSKLKELLASIEKQDFLKDEMEILTITEGTSESAKAIGIKQAKGDIIGILASDNELTCPLFLKHAVACTEIFYAAYPNRYHWTREDNVLNRYFALIGGNDPLSYYMRKNDKEDYLQTNWYDGFRTVGDNGFFIKRDIIMQSNLNNYYHIDNIYDIREKITLHAFSGFIWHKTGGNILEFFKKRYHYGLQHAFNKNRRWHLVDFSKPKDIWRLIWFILATITIIQPVTLSIYGWCKIQDKAWFLHPVICILTLIIYTALICHLGLLKLFQLLFAPMVVRRV